MPPLRFAPTFDGVHTMIRDFKEDTKVAAQYLSEQGVSVSHTALLEALSRAIGERNWSTLRAQLNKLQEPAQREEAAESAPDWDASQGPMSDAQYVRYGTNLCPVCGSPSIEAENINADGAIAWDNNTCVSCGSTWSTEFKAVGYFDLVEAAKPETSQDSPATSQEGSEALREDIVQEMVDDVLERARKYGFSVQGGEHAEELAAESNRLLKLDATEDEIFEAALRLA